MNAIKLFRAGHDYIQIANLLRTTEAEIERIIHRQRNEEIAAERRKANRRIEWKRNKERLAEMRKERA